MFLLVPTHVPQPPLQAPYRTFEFLFGPDKKLFSCRGVGRLSRRLPIRLCFIAKLINARCQFLDHFALLRRSTVLSIRFRSDRTPCNSNWHAGLFNSSKRASSTLN